MESKVDAVPSYTLFPGKVLITSFINLYTQVTLTCFLINIIYLLFSQVSHHPTLVACHCEGRGWKFWADSDIKSRFWGQSIQLDPVGLLTLKFDDGEVFQWSKVWIMILLNLQMFWSYLNVILVLPYQYVFCCVQEIN
mgnify:CR=1 FL=1